MADFNIIKISYRLDGFIDIYNRLSKNIIIFGQNGFAGYIINYLKKKGIFVSAIFDNNIKKHNSICEGIKVCAPNKDYIDNSYVIIASAYYDEMLTQLVNMGYSQKNVFDLLKGGANNGRELLEKDIIEAELKKAIDGYAVLNRINKNNYPMYLAPVSSIGDIYLLCLYFKQYLYENKIDDYVLAIPGASGVKLSKYFGYKSVEILQEEADALVKYRLVMGRELSNVYVLHCGYLHVRVPCYMLMYKKRTWIENYSTVIFQLQEKKQIEFSWPELPNDKLTELHNIGLKQGESVVIAPYANTISDLSSPFWEKLVEQLQKKGFTCFTNVTPKQREIKGTKRLELEVEYMPKTVEYAGFFIGLRSGLCDIVSRSNCKKIVLYTQEIFETIKVIDFYTLRGMGLCDDVFEMEVTYDIEMDVRRVVEEL